MRWVVVIALAGCAYDPSPGVAPASDAANDLDATIAPDTSADAPPPDTTTLPACATNPSYVPGPGGIRYFLSSTLATWTAAAAECATQGAHLAVIDDAGENAHVAGLSDTHFWIGMTDQGVEGTWLWVTGGSVDAGFTSWRAQQPNDDNGQDCGEMDANAPTWNDFTCADETLFACECPP